MDHMEILASIEHGDVVLIGKDMPMWFGCLMVVQEVRSWGVTGSIAGPSQTYYPLRVGLENIVTVFRERR